MVTERVRALQAQGVVIPEPEHVVVATDVRPERIEAGAVLHAGVRIEGERTLICRGARLGTGGPVLVRQCGIGPDVELASGAFEDAVFFAGSSFGPSGHARAGTLFEEKASAAHAVGTKQTILLPFATLGSNINFCDALLAGGTGARDHSEVGSGFIHFNFTPFGPAGDKATPSLFGDVPRGVWLREPRIFLGGAGGVVGPIRIGFGTALGAGSTYRRDRGENLLVLAERLPERELPLDLRAHRRARHRVLLNLEYLANLVALHRFHATVRAPLARGPLAAGLVQLSLAALEGAVRERVRQLERYAEGFESSAQALDERSGPDDPEVVFQRRFPSLLAEVLPRLIDAKDWGRLGDGAAFERLARSHPLEGDDAIAWIRSLSDAAVAEGRRWLQSVAEGWLAAPEGAGRLKEALHGPR